MLVVFPQINLDGTENLTPKIRGLTAVHVYIHGLSGLPVCQGSQHPLQARLATSTLLFGHSPRQKVFRETNLCLATE